MADPDISALLFPLQPSRPPHHHHDRCSIFHCLHVRGRTIGAAFFGTEICKDMSEKSRRLSDHISLCPSLVNLCLLRFLLRFNNYLFIASLSRERQSFRNQAAVLFHAVVVLIHGTVVIVLTAKFSRWSAGWNIGMVVSVLEEDEDGKGIYGTDALQLGMEEDMRIVTSG